MDHSRVRKNMMIVVIGVLLMSLMFGCGKEKFGQDPGESGAESQQAVEDPKESSEVAETENVETSSENGESDVNDAAENENSDTESSEDENANDESSDYETANNESSENENADKEYEEMKLFINGEEVPVTWEENESVEALKELVPLTVEMSMYGGFEQVGYLGTSITRNDVQTVTSYGDIVLYSGNQIVIFYGSNSWAYTRLGHVELSQEEMARLLSNGDVVIELK